MAYWVGESRPACHGRVICRGVHSGHRIDFGSRVSGRFKIGFFVYIDFYMILKFILKSVRLQNRVNIEPSGLF